MVDDEPDGDAQSAAGGVVDALEWFKVEGDGDVTQGAADFPSLPALSRSAESRRWASGHNSFLSYLPLQPPPPLYSAGAIGAHNPVGLSSLDQGAESRARLGRWTESVEINTNSCLVTL